MTGGPERSRPTDLPGAARAALSGTLVEVQSMIPAGLPVHDREDLQRRIPERFDWLASVVRSQDFIEFQSATEQALQPIHGKTIFMDLEGTIVNDIASGNFRLHYGDPYMVTIPQVLARRNRVGFWTSASNKYLNLIQAALPPDLASLPAIGRDTWEKVVQAYGTEIRYGKKPEDTLAVIRSVYPYATEATYRAGLLRFQSFDQDWWEDFDEDPDYFLEDRKYPDIFVAPQDAYFIDDNPHILEKTTAMNWPADHAIQCRYNGWKEGAEELIEQLLLRN